MHYSVSSLKAKFINFLLVLVSAFVSHNNCLEKSARISKLGYNLQLYNSINSYRTKHTIRMLEWNLTLVETAEKLATEMIKASKLDIGKSEGVNFFVNSGFIQPPPSFVTGSWYNESIYYDFSNPNYNPSTLNFTAMMWKSSTSVGISSYTTNNRTSTVAKFYPAGNIRGEFRENVIPIYKKW